MDAGFGRRDSGFRIRDLRFGFRVSGRYLNVTPISSDSLPRKSIVKPEIPPLSAVRDWFRVSGFGFRVSGFDCRVSGFDFRVSGFGLRVLGFEFQVSSFRSRVSGFGSGFRVSGPGFWASGFGFRVSGSDSRVAGFGLRDAHAKSHRSASAP